MQRNREIHPTKTECLQLLSFQNDNALIRDLACPSRPQRRPAIRSSLTLVTMIPGRDHKKRGGGERHSGVSNKMF